MDLNTTLFVVGRVLLGGYFLMSAWNHFAHSAMLSGYAGSKGVPAAKGAVLVSGLLLLAGGLGILTGRYTVWALWALVLFLMPVTFMMHQYWKVQDPMMKMGERVNFMKNMALLGAVLMLMSLSLPWAASL